MPTPTPPTAVSDFYAPRRTAIADIAGLVGMGLLGSVSTMLVWDDLAGGFRTGRLEKAFLVFLLVVLGASALGGVLGLLAGRVIGRVWERRHRARRGPVRGDRPDADVSPTDAVRPAPSEAQVASAPGIELRSVGADVAGIMALMQRAGDAGPTRTADVLRRSVGIGAWDGPRLVGMARFVSDGRHGLLSDLVVEPAYRRRGIGRALVEAACREAGGALTIESVPESAIPFVHAIGATPGGWTLGAAQRAP
ncbi:MAG: GNAT family N-acetyltransferase [Gemmatimonadaceae bacterium]|nr:GNAT family N-acetyltransferase [Gemmatimonadaceae bacterium]